MPKSSQAARNSCLSAARSSASRRRQAGSILKKLNLAKVRSAIGATIALLVIVAVGPGGQGASLNFFGGTAVAAGEAGNEKVQDASPPAHPAHASVTLAFLPPRTTLDQLAWAGFSPGLMSAGLGRVAAEQTYLDVSQGNRVFDSLYGSDLPELERSCPPWWESVVERAESAPADIVPGLLASTLEAAGLDVRARGEASCALSPHPTSDSSNRSSKKSSGSPRPDVRRPVFEVREMSLAETASLARSLPTAGLLIALARPTGESDDPLPIGIVGGGFDGNLTSGSTRTGGYVLSTDVAPTILGHLGIDVPSEMSGQAIESEGSVDPAAIEELGARMGVISERRGPVIGWSLLAWLGLLALVVA